MRTSLFVLLALATACGGAGGHTSDSTATVDRDTLTRHQKDSILGQSELPGARGVSGALSAQDTNAARQRVIDSIANEP